MVDASNPSAPKASGRRRRRIRLRPWLRALHRDVGYFSVGLTFIYALSGLAVNHIADWEPNFQAVEKQHQIKGQLPSGDDALAKHVVESLGLRGPIREVYRVDEAIVEVVLDRRTLTVNATAGTVAEQGSEPRFFLRIANWLHLNRGKKAWTVIADGYAVFLLVLATSGLVMLPGRKGVLGRAGLIAAVGAMLPTAYVALSGGP